MDGIIVVNKPIGKTSHDIVNIMRRFFNMKRIGHTGTLDPDATGVLPVCLGKGTKTADMLTASDKAYRACVKLGITTDTQDISGEILSEKEVSVSEDDIISVVKSFVGKQQQIPPMYSALKVGGRKLCDLAREGITIERKARDIEIFDIKFSDYNEAENTFVIDVSCSKGTYIRTLCHDIGEKLGCGAVMASLVRTKSGRFDIKDALTIEEIEEKIKSGEINSHIIPVDMVFSELEKIVVNADNERRIRNGISPRCTDFVKGRNYRVYNENGEFLCVSECITDENGYMVLKMLKSFYG